MHRALASASKDKDTSSCIELKRRLGHTASDIFYLQHERCFFFIARSRQIHRNSFFEPAVSHHADPARQSNRFFEVTRCNSSTMTGSSAENGSSSNSRSDSTISARNSYSLALAAGELAWVFLQKAEDGTAIPSCCSYVLWRSRLNHFGNQRSGRNGIQNGMEATSIIAASSLPSRILSDMVN
jgi:hypothetical protein